MRGNPVKKPVATLVSTTLLLSVAQAWAADPVRDRPDLHPAA